MNSVEEAIQTRLTGDSVGNDSLQYLLGGSGRVFHAFEQFEPKVGMLTHFYQGGRPGDINADSAQTETGIYQFNIFSDTYEAVKERVIRLLQGHQFPTPSDAGIKGCTLEWIGPDEFDEPLKCGVKRMRFKIEICRSAQAPV